MAYTNIDDPSAYFQATTYSGTGSTGNAITNSGNSDLQPDMVWIKVRTYDNAHTIQDTSRGFAASGEVKLLQTASDAGEVTNGAFVSFDTDGFEVGGTNPTSRAYNGSTDSYIAWQWKANAGSTSSNTSGTITSTVQANTDAGFSIVTYTGNGDPYGNTFGHGLGAAPKMVIVKRRSSSQSWAVYHEAIGAGNYLRFNALNASAASSAHWYNTAPTSTLVYVGGNGEVNGSSETYVAYCFAEKQGYSKFGKYTGAGGNSPFVYTGFKPALVICKRIDSTNDWGIVDSKRETYNGATKTLFADLVNQESSTYTVDLLSNGFRPASNHSIFNQNGGSYIYMAFAENPFVTSTGIPTTAR